MYQVVRGLSACQIGVICVSNDTQITLVENVLRSTYHRMGATLPIDTPFVNCTQRGIHHEIELGQAAIELLLALIFIYGGPGSSLYQPHPLSSFDSFLRASSGTTTIVW